MARLALVSSSPAVPFGSHGAVGAGPKWSSRPSSRPSPMAGAATCRELTGHSLPGRVHPHWHSGWHLRLTSTSSTGMRAVPSRGPGGSGGRAASPSRLGPSGLPAPPPDPARWPARPHAGSSPAVPARPASGSYPHCGTGTCHRPRSWHSVPRGAGGRTAPRLGPNLRRKKYHSTRSC